jgi:hypothetical protein
MSRRSDETEFRHFADWCRERGLKPMPAHPWTVAAYARWMQRRHRLRTIARRVDAIVREHLFRGQRLPDRDPVVARTLDSIETDAPRRAAPDLFAVPRLPKPDAGPAGTEEAGAGEPGTGAGDAGAPVNAKRCSRRGRALRGRPRLVSKRSGASRRGGEGTSHQ